jgi:hypothetical protein
MNGGARYPADATQQIPELLVHWSKNGARMIWNSKIQEKLLDW